MQAFLLERLFTQANPVDRMIATFSHDQAGPFACWQDIFPQV
jgi:hypothetical protein